ncbi:hypothetical protein BSLA_01f1954 [Burkholderia stabilis]|nr:hypothetical protein BSLA_01f1954 [Burkholderia stabilis]
MRQARNGRSTGREHPAGIRPYTRSRATRSRQPATRNPQPATRNPQPATRNPQLATRNPHPAQETGRKPYMTPLYRTAPMRFERRSQA